MIHEVRRLNLNYPTSRAVWKVDGQAVGTLHGVAKSDAAWGTATIAIYRSNTENGPWFALESDQTLGPGNFMSAAFNIDFAWLAAEVVADEAADEYVDLTLYTNTIR